MPKYIKTAAALLAVALVVGAFVAGSASAQRSRTFDDVPSGSYYEDSAYWAADNAITTGCSAEPLRFCPHDTLTRAQMITFLKRYHDNVVLPAIHELEEQQDVLGTTTAEDISQLQEQLDDVVALTTTTTTTAPPTTTTTTPPTTTTTVPSATLGANIGAWRFYRHTDGSANYISDSNNGPERLWIYKDDGICHSFLATQDLWFNHHPTVNDRIWVSYGNVQGAAWYSGETSSSILTVPRGVSTSTLHNYLREQSTARFVVLDKFDSDVYTFDVRGASDVLAVMGC